MTNAMRTGNYDELVQHTREARKIRPIRCSNCGKLFLQEKEKIEARRHRF
ncbi:MAG TPA: hypothetical protein VNI77_07930 [Nitrososphaera sp.]|nr:hypothetical protein [Nitrososphaera sp.]